MVLARLSASVNSVTSSRRRELRLPVHTDEWRGREVYDSCKQSKLAVPGNEARHAATPVWHYYTRYLGLGMRYEAGVCTIVISMNGAFK